MGTRVCFSLWLQSVPRYSQKNVMGRSQEDEDKDSEKDGDLLALGTCLPAPVSEKKVLGDESSLTFWSVGALFHEVQANVSVTLSVLAFMLTMISIFDQTNSSV